MSTKSALIIGATGQTGGHLLKELLASPHFSKVGEYGRRVTAPDTLAEGKEKLEQKKAAQAEREKARREAAEAERREAQAEMRRMEAARAAERREYEAKLAAMQAQFAAQASRGPAPAPA